MVSKKFSIIWDVEAVNDFKSAYQYIKKELSRAAKKVKREIINAVKKIALHPTLINLISLKSIIPGTTELLKNIVTG
jgi:plasmid stabilization system protein ParE